MNRAKFVQTLYRKLLHLYPREFREQFGESMAQTFHDLWREHSQTNQPGFGFVGWLFLETALGMFKEHWRVQGGKMHTHLRTLGAAAIIGLVVVLPFLLLEVVNGQSAGFPVALFIGLWLLPMLCAWIVLPVIQRLRGRRERVAGSSSPQGSLWISVLLVLPLIVVWAALVIDQMPCFLGIPNCD